MPFISSVEGNYVGIGIGALPDYMGSNDYRIGAMPMVRYELGDHRNVELIGNYASMNLLRNEHIRFGPAVRYRFGRDDDVDDPVVSQMPKIDDTLEAGLTLSSNWVLNNDSRNRVSIGIDGLWDVGGTSDGFNGSVYGRYWMPASESIDIGLGGAVRYGDSSFNDTYFGVTPAGSAASGLPGYTADSGLNSFDITPMAVMHLSSSWHLGAGLRYSRLVGDAADSPLVKDRGDENQFVGGIGLVYSWGGKVNRN